MRVCVACGRERLIAVDSLKSKFRAKYIRRRSPCLFFSSLHFPFSRHRSIGALYNNRATVNAFMRKQNVALFSQLHRKELCIITSVYFINRHQFLPVSLSLSPYS